MEIWANETNDLRVESTTWRPITARHHPQFSDVQRNNNANPQIPLAWAFQSVAMDFYSAHGLTRGAATQFRRVAGLKLYAMGRWSVSYWICWTPRHFASMWHQESDAAPFRRMIRYRQSALSVRWLSSGTRAQLLRVFGI